MWSFVNTFGSHSPHVKIKTHYSSRVSYSYNNPLLILTSSEHAPPVNGGADKHIMVVLTNTKGDVERHRVCDKHIIKVAEPSPAGTVLILSTRGLLSIIVMVPSDQPQYMGE